MRRLILSDIHAHLGALRAVLDDAGPVDEVWCLGDVVGLGPHPEECIALIRDLGAYCIPGNHDLGAIGRGGGEFQRVALLAESNPWTQEMLSQESLVYLAALAEHVVLGDFTLAHDVAEFVGKPGGTRAPSPDDVAHLHTRRGLVGHFHLPFLLREDAGVAAEITSHVPEPDIPLDLGAERSFLNPGPVGVPDWLPGHAAYVIEDADLISATATLTLRFIPIDLAPGLADIDGRYAPPQVRALWQRQVADVVLAAGDLRHARALYAEAAAVFRDGRSLQQAHLLLTSLASLAAQVGDHDGAAVLLAAALGERLSTAHPVLRYRAEQLTARLDLSPDALAEARARGGRLALADAIDLGLSV